MKRYTLILSLIGIVLLLTSFTFNTNGDRNEVDVVVRTVEGHKYIIVTNYSRYAGRPGGISIVHAESCNCKNKTNNYGNN